MVERYLIRLPRLMMVIFQLLQDNAFGGVDEKEINGFAQYQRLFTHSSKSCFEGPLSSFPFFQLTFG